MKGAEGALVPFVPARCDSALQSELHNDSKSYRGDDRCSHFYCIVGYDVRRLTTLFRQTRAKCVDSAATLQNLNEVVIH